MNDNIGRINRRDELDPTVFVHDTSNDLSLFAEFVNAGAKHQSLKGLLTEDLMADMEVVFADHVERYALTDIAPLTQTEARVRSYLEGSLSGEQWPEDFETLNDDVLRYGAEKARKMHGLDNDE